MLLAWLFRIARFKAILRAVGKSIRVDSVERTVEHVSAPAELPLKEEGLLTMRTLTGPIA